MDKPEYLKPCLVIGTGFHRWVLGASMAGHFQPLLDWNALLLQVAAGLGIALDRTAQSLSLHWERLLTTGLNDGLGAHIPMGASGALTAGRLELLAKRQAVQVLAQSKGDYPAHSRRARLPLEDAWGAVVSLNFDAHWWADAPMRLGRQHDDGGDTQPVMAHRAVLAQELKRLNNYMALPSSAGTKRLWFPNGFIGQPASLRLGLREFGFQPTAIQHAFASLKAFERSTGSFEQRIGFVRAALHGRSTLNRLFDGACLPLTWVTEMLYRPVFFAGVGMSDAEVGLWWLMVQRARNIANVAQRHRPKAFILIKADDARIDFWRAHPCGIEPLICSSWDEGWTLLEDVGRSIEGV